MSEPGGHQAKAVLAGYGGIQEASRLFLWQIVKRRGHSSADWWFRNRPSSDQCRTLQDGAVSVVQRERLLSLRREMPVCARVGRTSSNCAPSTVQDGTVQGIPQHGLLCLWCKVIYHSPLPDTWLSVLKRMALSDVVWDYRTTPVSDQKMVLVLHAVVLVF